MNLAGIAGAALIFFIGWEYNIPAAVWLAYPLLIYTFRRKDKWYKTLFLIPIMVIARFFSINGGWDMAPVLTVTFAFVVCLPLILSLYLDRAASRRLPPFPAVFVFPVTYVVLDYLLTFANLGMTFSIAYSQSTFLPLVQSASLFGSWFAEFVVLWFAPVAVLAFENIKRPGAVKRPLAVFCIVLAAVLAFGWVRLAFDKPKGATVRIASITEAHDRDYWTITDAGTPEEDAEANRPAMIRIQDNLFASSQKAADYGAKIIFWSEGNCPIYEDDFDDFMTRAKSFAKDNSVYFMPAVVELLYGQTKNRNLAIMISPEGEVAFEYEKTISWYPSDSDGVIPVIDTPYGRLSSAICFDNDYPMLISQANNADIMLIPAFDTKKIDDFHTRVAFLRGIENGYSTVRQSNEGSSISADYLGNTLTYQNYFRTEDRIMISDVPMQGRTTLYGSTGEIFLWLDCAAFAALMVYCFSRGRRTQNSDLTIGK
jgi:apolipoprotein N-acyltransferase